MSEFLKFKGDIDLQEITGRDIEQFVGTKRQSASHVTARAYHLHLRASLGVAQRWGRVPDNVVTIVARPSAAEPPPVYLTGEEFKRILSVVRDPHFRDLLIVAVGTGLRLGELLSLTHEFLDLHRRVIRVGSRDFTTKSGKVRSVPMGEEVYRVLRVRAGAGPVFHLGTGERVS